MRIFLAVCEEPRTDPMIQPFSTAEAALAWCKAFEDSIEDKQDFEVRDFKTNPDPSGTWIYSSDWGDGEFAHVEVRDLDDSDPRW